MLSSQTLRLTESQYATIVGHCYDGLPHEACGLLVGPLGSDGAPTGAVTRAWPCRNEAESALLYTVDGRDFLKASRSAGETGDEIVGVWHSHTHSDPYPSPTDVKQAVDPTWWYVIVSLRDDTPMLRAYKIVDGSINEGRVELDSG